MTPPFYINIGLILGLLALYVIPVSLGIMLLYWGLRRLGYVKTAQIARKYLFIALAFGFIAINIIEWHTSHHTVVFKIDSKYGVKLAMHELDSFLDWPIACRVAIENLKNEKEVVFDFVSNGPYYQFLQMDNLIWVKGYNNSMNDWVVDMEKLEVSKNTPDNEEGFILRAEVQRDFQVKER